MDRLRSKTYKLTALLNESRDQARNAENRAREAKIRAKEAIAARQDAEREVIRLHSIIGSFPNKSVLPPILNTTAHTLQQKPSPILLPFTPQMYDPSLKSFFDPQVATARNTEAQH